MLFKAQILIPLLTESRTIHVNGSSLSFFRLAEIGGAKPLQ